MYVRICRNPRVMVPTLHVYSDHHHLHSRQDYKQCIVIEDISLCFNTHNKTSNLLRQKHNNIIQYRYLTMAKYFGHSLDYVQANVYKSIAFVYTL